MNGDVWRELEERLKQKAKSLNELVEDSEKFQSFIERLASEQNIDLFKVWTTLFKDNKWVRLEDVQKLIEEIKEKYALVPKKKLMEKLAEIKLYGTKINGQLSDKPEYSPRYLADFIEKELLKEC